jgi:gliding motility-associated-like protein
MSFEGTPQPNIPPNGWNPCNEFSSPDTQPGFWEVAKAASNGSTYISLVTRGNLGPYANHNEGVQTELLVPFAKDNTYDVSIDLSYSKEFGHFIDFDSDFLHYDTPAKLRISGGATSCDKLEILWESPVIDHIDWKSYALKLQPKTGDINYLIFEAAFAKDSTYFGNVLIDNLSVDFCSLATPIETQSFDSLICENASLILDASTPGGIYKWSTGSTEPSITVMSAGTFAVEVSNGCDSQIFEYTIEEKECRCEISVPNVFTPNGDDFNETFEIRGTPDIAKFDLRIFNRWGQLVYQTNKIEDYWKGNINGGASASGIYYWTISMICVDGMSIIENSYKGLVTITK